jgi:hypothetical protein
VITCRCGTILAPGCDARYTGDCCSFWVQFSDLNCRSFWTHSGVRGAFISGSIFLQLLLGSERFLATNLNIFDTTARFEQLLSLSPLESLLCKCSTDIEPEQLDVREFREFMNEQPELFVRAWVRPSASAWNYKLPGPCTVRFVQSRQPFNVSAMFDFECCKSTFDGMNVHLYAPWQAARRLLVPTEHFVERVKCFDGSQIRYHTERLTHFRDRGFDLSRCLYYGLFRGDLELLRQTLRGRGPSEIWSQLGKRRVTRFLGKVLQPSVSAIVRPKRQRMATELWRLR